VPRKRSFGYVRKLPSGRFQASYVAPNGLRRTAPKTFLTKTDAGKWLDRMRASIEEGRWRDPLLGRELFVDYAERWITERPGLRPRTVDLYRWLLKRYLRPELERVRLADMTPLVVRRWRTHMLDAGVSETMVAKSYRLMRAVLYTAVDDDILDRNPCRIRGGGDENAAERPTLTARQVQQLSMAVPPRFSAFVAVKTYGTLRWGEITALQRRDIDLEEGSVRVQAAFTERSDGSLSLGPPKSRAGIRKVVLPRPVLEMLRAHLDTYVYDEPEALVFTGPTGRPLRRSNFNKLVRWPEACAAIGLPGLHLHDPRHTGNTLAAATPGTSTRDLMDRMGHDDMRAALIYQHATRDANRRIADALELEIARGRRDGEGDSTIARRSHDRRQRRLRTATRNAGAPESGASEVERVTGIEPALSAWENHRPMTRRRRKPGILRTPTILTRPSLTANDRSSPTRIARQSHDPRSGRPAAGRRRTVPMRKCDEDRASDVRRLYDGVCDLRC
jgi:integrase